MRYFEREGPRPLFTLRSPAKQLFIYKPLFILYILTRLVQITQATGKHSEKLKFPKV